MLKSATLLFFHCALLFSPVLFGQSNITSSGGDASGSGGSVAYSLGQIDYIQFSSTTGAVNLGVQQTYAIDDQNNLNEIGELVSVTVGPNPSNEWLTIESKENTDLFYFVTYSNGKILLHKIPLANSQQISMKNWSNGTYFLHITHFEIPVKQIKLIKY